MKFVKSNDYWIISWYKKKHWKSFWRSTKPSSAIMELCSDKKHLKIGTIMKIISLIRIKKFQFYIKLYHKTVQSTDGL